MSGLRWIQLSEAELSEFLGDGGTGVLSFSTDGDEPPFTLPVSYGYLADTGRFHYRLAIPDGSTKEQYVDRPVSFVVHDETEAGWRSVVATGVLEDLTKLPYEADALQERWGVNIPLVDIFEDPPDDVTFRPFRLDPERVTGRKEVQS